MNLSLIFALSSMLCAGLNDFIFKRYVSKDRTQGAYLALIGVVWALIFYVAALSSGGLRFDRNTLMYGLICGFFSIAAQVFFLKSLQKVNTTVGATIYRLNFIVVVILAPIFLHEALTPLKLTGLLLTVAAVFLLSKNGEGSETSRYRSSALPVLLVITASLLRGFMGFFYKVAQVHGIDTNTFLYINALLWIAGGTIYVSFFERDASKNINTKLLIYSGISGLLVAGITLFLLLAVKKGEAIVAVPITQMSFIVTGILSVWLLKERVTLLKGLGIICALGTIICLSH